MKRLLAIPFLLLAAGLAYAPPPPPATSQPIPIVQHIAKALPAQVKDIPLDVTGAGVKDATKVVYEPKIQKYKTVESFPFTVKAPAGAFMYFWQYPALLPVVDRNDELDITSAPEGDLVIRVKAVYLIIDDKGVFKGAETKIGTMPLWIGKAPPGPVPPGPPGPTPPVPPTPEPPASLIADLKTALSKDGTSAANMDKAKVLAEFSKKTAEECQNKKYATAGELFQFWKLGSSDILGNNAMMNFRTTVGQYLNEKLSSKYVPTTAITQEIRNEMTLEWNKLGTAIGRAAQ